MPEEPAYSSAEEPQLVQWAKVGDMQAFEELVPGIATASTCAPTASCATRTLAVDLSQNAWVKAWQRLEQFHGEASFPTWLSRIVTNLCLDELRRQKRARTDSIEAMEETTGPVENRMEVETIDPVEGLSRGELRERIDAALAKLSDKHRTVIVLYEFEQLEYREIAEKMGTSIGTVMSRLFYARKRLASLLKETLKRDGLIE